MRLETGDDVRYVGTEDIQVNYAGHADPRPFLEEGKVYRLVAVHVDRWWTDYWLKGINEDTSKRGFNSVSFEYVPWEPGDEDDHSVLPISGQGNI